MIFLKNQNYRRQQCLRPPIFIEDEDDTIDDIDRSKTSLETATIQVRLGQMAVGQRDWQQ